MNQNDLYKEWIQSRKAPGPSPGFSSKVMDRIRQMEQKERTVSALGYGLGFLETRLLRIVFASALSALGIFRIGYVTVRLLVP